MTQQSGVLRAFRALILLMSNMHSSYCSYYLPKEVEITVAVKPKRFAGDWVVRLSILTRLRKCAGSNFVLLTSDGEQSMHGSNRAVAGEFAIVPPFLGSSQRLLNRDHYSVYYKVDS